jgi:BlaI family transcriptional regulator, penicillinase repressor
VNPEKARRNALHHLVETFFEGSPARAVAALLDKRSARMSAEELDRLSNLIEEAKQEGF